MRAPLRSVLGRRATAWCGLVAVATLAACNTDRAVGPSADRTTATLAPGGVANGDVITGPLTTLISKTALTWPTSRRDALVRSFTVRQDSGSTLELPEVGLVVQVPKGAIPTAQMTITITVLPGLAVAYSFEPHGTVFRKPLIVQQNLALTSWAGNTGLSFIGAGYFANDNQVNPLTGTVLLNELLPANLIGTRLRFAIQHFSGYMVSTD